MFLSSSLRACITLRTTALSPHDHGAEVDALNDLGNTPLHSVSQGEYKSQEDGARVAQLLLERGADVYTPDKNHSTPLHAASYFGRLEITQLLINHGAEVDALADFGNTPLHSVSQGKYESQEDGARVAQLLLERGADVNTPDKNHSTPLHAASYFGRLEITQVLIDFGADVGAVDHFGKTPLHDVSRGIYEFEDVGVRIAQLLLNHGADGNVKTGSGTTPLAFVSCRKRPKLAKLLRGHAANVNLQSQRASSSQADYFKW